MSYITYLDDEDDVEFDHQHHHHEQLSFHSVDY